MPDIKEVALVLFPLLCLAMLIRAALFARKAMPDMAEWRQGLCGTAIMLSFLACIASIVSVVIANLSAHGELTIPLIITAALFCPVTLIIAGLLRGKVGYSLMVAEFCQAAFLLLVLGSRAVL